MKFEQMDVLRLDDLYVKQETNKRYRLIGMTTGSEAGLLHVK